MSFAVAVLNFDGGLGVRGLINIAGGRDLERRFSSPEAT
jgi:hypothetical protein